MFTVIDKARGAESLLGPGSPSPMMTGLSQVAMIPFAKSGVQIQLAERFVFVFYAISCDVNTSIY